jgi:CheY-like chemotaxis protein
MDVQMPVMDGLDAARAIRTAERLTGRARTPIVALTANVLSHQTQDYLTAGMDTYVGKPIEIGKLYAALDAVLNLAKREENRPDLPSSSLSHSG